MIRYLKLIAGLLVLWLYVPTAHAQYPGPGGGPIFSKNCAQSPQLGHAYVCFDTTTNGWFYWNGTAFTALASGGGPPTGAAGGDLGGTYPNPTVTSGTHLGAGTVPNASLVTTPITACSGDINSGCSQVTSGAHLGASTVPNTAIPGWPTTYLYDLSGGTATTAASFPNGTTMGSALNLKVPITFSNICMLIQTSDGTGLYDWGIYNSSGVLVADVGPQHIGGTLTQCKPTVQGAVTLNAGNYGIGITGNATTAAIYRTTNAECAWFSSSMTGGTTTGGQLAASGLTIPSVSPAATCIQIVLY